MEISLDKNVHTQKAKLKEQELKNQNENLKVITPPAEYNPHLNLGGMFYTVNENKTNLAKTKYINDASKPNLQLSKHKNVVKEIKSKTM